MLDASTLIYNLENNRICTPSSKFSTFIRLLFIYECKMVTTVTLFLLLIQTEQNIYFISSSIGTRSSVPWCCVSLLMNKSTRPRCPTRPRHILILCFSCFRPLSHSIWFNLKCFAFSLDNLGNGMTQNTKKLGNSRKPKRKELTRQIQIY